MSGDAHYTPDGLIDLEFAKQHVRQLLAVGYGDPLTSAQAQMAAGLADQLARRPGRDAAMCGDALLEASQCLAGMAALSGQLHGYVVLLVNILGIAGVDLSDKATTS